MSTGSQWEHPFFLWYISVHFCQLPSVFDLFRLPFLVRQKFSSHLLQPLLSGRHWLFYSAFVMQCALTTVPSAPLAPPCHREGMRRFLICCPGTLPAPCLFADLQGFPWIWVSPVFQGPLVLHTPLQNHYACLLEMLVSPIFLLLQPKFS